MLSLLCLICLQVPKHVLPRGGKSVIRVPKQIPAPKSFLAAAKGFAVDLFADNLNQPRKLAIAPNGDVFVVQTRLERPIRNMPHGVVVLSGFDKDQRPTVKTTWTTDLVYPFGIQFGFGHLYVANTDSIVRWSYRPGQTTPSEKPEVILDHIPANGYRNHWTRNILFDSQLKSIFLTIGSVGNLDPEDARRAVIERYRLDSSGRIVGGREVYASGMRNPIGLAIQPGTGRLWANVAERDYEGDDLVPDFTTSVRPHGFYGWPYSLLGVRHDPKMPRNPALEKTTIVPDIWHTAHSTPIDIVFIPEGAVVTLHGSQNRSKLCGYKVVLIPFGPNHKPSGPPRDLVTGWLPKWSNREIYGRPAGLAVTRDGSILIVDDWGGKIWRLRRTHS
jgi:glucose/arabinose dehydrogenase